jgi:RNA polymerase sigma-70 factor, ECF subfamily
MESCEFDSGIDRDTTRLIKRKARNLVGESGFTESDIEDLEQDLLLDLLQRRPHYDPARAAWMLFACCALDHRAATLKEAQRAKKRNYRLNEFSLNERMRSEEGEYSERGESITLDDYLLRTGRASRPMAELLELRCKVRALINRLSPKLRELCLQLMTKTVTEIAQDTGVSRETIYQARKKLQRIFEEAGLRDYQ